MPNYRINRISEELKRSLDRIIRDELNDPRIGGTFSIMRVEATPDLKEAKVYVSVLEEAKSAELLKALKNASGFLRYELGKQMQIRSAPALKFIADHNIEYGIHIAQVLRDVNASKEADTHDQPDSD